MGSGVYHIGILMTLFALEDYGVYLAVALIFVTKLFDLCELFVPALRI